MNPPTQNTDYEYLANNYTEKRSTAWYVFGFMAIVAVFLTLLLMVTRP